MKIRRIKDSNELDRFRKLTNKFIHVLLPMEYLNRSRVFGCFDSKGRICGGFVLVMEGPFRVLDSIPMNSEDQIFDKLNQTCEVTGLWFVPSKKDRSKSLKFWLRLYVEMLRTNMKYFVYAFSMSKPQIGKMYEPARPVRLFKGKTHILPGMDEYDYEVVEYMNRKNLYLFPVRSPDFLVKRLKHNINQKVRKVRFFFKKQYA